MSGRHARLVLASTNKGKAKEFAARFAAADIALSSLADYPALPAVVEDGATFRDNAVKKARETAEALGIPALADDSGLCVDRLSGRPGVLSARYAGEHASDADNVHKLLLELGALGGAPEHAPPGPEGCLLLSPASFVCALALYDPASGELTVTEGACSGWIIDARRGSGGFGYDPVFYIPRYSRTMAELTMEEKNAVSHRGQAIDKLMLHLI